MFPPFESVSGWLKNKEVFCVRERETVHVGRQHRGPDRPGEGEPRPLAPGSQCGRTDQLGVLWVLPFCLGDG